MLITFIEETALRSIGWQEWQRWKMRMEKGDPDGSLFSLVLINNHFLILFLAVL